MFSSSHRGFLFDTIRRQGRTFLPPDGGGAVDFGKGEYTESLLTRNARFT